MKLVYGKITKGKEWLEIGDLRVIDLRPVVRRITLAHYTTVGGVDICTISDK